MTWLGVVGIIVALAAIIFLAMRSYSILVIAPLCALVVVLTNHMNVVDALLANPSSSYMFGLGGFVAKFFLIFLLGAILGKYMENSGAAKSIARWIISKTGSENPYAILIAIMLIGAILTYGGVSLFVAIFAIIPVARPLFKKLNLPWHLFMVPLVLGTATFTMTMLPGSPSIQNVIPTAYLHTTLTAAPLVGIVATVVIVVFGLWYMKRELNKAAANGEVFNEPEVAAVAEADDADLPSTLVSFLPLIVLIATVIIGSVQKVDGIIVPALLLADIVAALVFSKYVKSHIQTINAGAINGINPAIMTAAAVGFGVVVAAAPGFKIIAKAVLSIPGNPLISVAAATGLLGCITASSSGALGIAMPAFAKAFLAMGINAGAIHRIAAIAAGIGCLPHAGAVFAFFAATGLNHRNAYRHIFWIEVFGQFLALVVALVAAIAIY
ncbi:MAG TPA: SLC13 family permease [Syntrophomonadaceae bacterium]|nr:SLC13 family permease [Syntrophomonadaceae bacterium]